MKAVKWILPVALGLMISCNDHGSHTSEPAEAPHHHHDGGTTGLQLNAGSKWKINDEMKAPLNDISTELSAPKPESLEAYHAMAERLTKHTDRLIAGCTMEGPAHEALHQWLMPFIDSVKALGDAKTEHEASEKLGEVKASMETFHAYFE
jgi:hypothetical protein